MQDAVITYAITYNSRMRKSGRPSEPVITYETVVDEALNIIDEEGLPRFSMRKLGRRLNINSTSLYHHFKNKDEILHAVAQKIVDSGNVPRARTPDSWEQALMTMAKSYRETILQHPNAAMLTSAHNPRPKNHENYERCLQNFKDAGFDPEESLLLMASIEVLSLGSAMAEVTGGQRIEFGAVDSENYPLLYEATQRKSIDLRNSFAQMCHLVLTGALKGQD